MVQKKATKTTAKSRSASTAARRTTTAKKPATKAKRSVATKRTVKKSRVTQPKVEKIDYYPNRVALLTATAAVLILLTLGFITAL